MLTKNFLQRVKEAKHLSLMKKEDLKRRKRDRLDKLIDTCKEHGSPIIVTSISLVKTLTSDQLIAEICYLRATTAPNIKQQRRIKLDNGHFRMEQFPIPDSEMKNAINPEREL